MRNLEVNNKANKDLSPRSGGAGGGLLMSLLSLGAAVGFGIAGFCVAPVGSISSSVLLLIAQFLVASATYLGLDVYFQRPPLAPPQGEKD